MQIRTGPDVCYARCRFPDCIEKTSDHLAGAGNPNQVYGQQTDERAGSVHASSSSAAHLLDVQTPLRVLGPADFAEHLRSRYPSLAMDELTILLKEQNARCQREINTARANMQADMIKFADKLMTSLGKRCVCCAARGFTDCPARAIDIRSGDTTRTPVGQKIPGVRLDMSACRDDTPTTSVDREDATTHLQAKRQ